MALTDERPPVARTPPAVRVVAVSKRFGDTVALEQIDLEVRAGEFFTLLGPSGSGKTTLLRLLAGFEQPTTGAILLDERNVTNLAPFDRDLNTVFQDYALFPHMTVLDNVAYGLRVKGVGKADRRRQAGDALESVRLGGFGQRKPSQLSGGQRQRVALARALVNRPKVLLLDEPLGALDLKLREEMQFELKSLQREVGITFVFVTHDQSEALTMSDRIAVFSQGRIEQVGTAREIYERPTNSFVAGFVGTSNLLSGRAAESVLGRTGTFLIRPEKIEMLVADGDDQTVQRQSGTGHRTTGVVDEVLYVGWETRSRVRLDVGGHLLVVEPNDDAGGVRPSKGDQVSVWWQNRHVIELAENVATTATGTDASLPGAGVPT